MRPEFHARYSATSRRYAYLVGTDEEARSPFRRHTEWAYRHKFERQVLDDTASPPARRAPLHRLCRARHGPADRLHRCTVTEARWVDRPGGLTFVVEANRFLHHMVRFLVGTMLAEASGQRDAKSVRELLTAETNDEVSPPAPAHGLVLEKVSYPAELYLS